MPYYYGIDLGTTNTVVSCMKLPKKELILTPNRRASIERVPIYYENFEWDSAKNVFIDSDEAAQRALESNTHQSGVSGSPYTLSSVVYEHIHNGSSTFLTGQPAQNMYDLEHRSHPDRFYEDTKSLMDQELDYKGMTAADIAYYLLKTCFQSIKRYSESGRIPRIPAAIGISYPAARNQQVYLANLRVAANRAAREAGLLEEDAAVDFFCTTQEPYAAITNLIMDECRQINDFKRIMRIIQPSSNACVNVMVVDIGGGTTDIAIQPVQLVASTVGHLPLYPESCPRTAADGDGYSTRSAVNLKGDFGGADFDVLLARKIARRLYEQEGMQQDVHQLPPYVAGNAINLARLVKHYFTDKPDAKEFRRNAPNFFAPLDRVHMPVLRVTREEYTRWIRPYIYAESDIHDPEGDYKQMGEGKTYSIQQIMKDTLEQARCRSWNDIDYVFVTGGMSKMPEIIEMIRATVDNGSESKLIISDKRQINVLNDSDSPRFSDIAYGVAVYACLTNSSATDGNLVPDGSGRKYSDYTASPHSSVALLADIDEGLPVVLIEHSQSLPVENHRKENVFTNSSTFGLWVQLYTGLSPYDPNLKKQMRCFVDLSKQPPFANTPIALQYSIDQNMYATLSVCYTDSQNIERVVNMRELNLDARGDSDN